MQEMNALVRMSIWVGLFETYSMLLNGHNKPAHEIGTHYISDQALRFIFRLKIKRNDWLLADTCAGLLFPLSNIVNDNIYPNKHI